MLLVGHHLSFVCVFILYCITSGANGQIQSLVQLNVDLDYTSVSGFSFGGTMSNALAFILSSKIKSVGAFTGSPYPGFYFLNHDPKFSPWELSSYVAAIKGMSAEGKIDNFSNTRGHKAFVHTGGNNFLPEFFAQGTRDVYKAFGFDTKYVVTPDAYHCVPTLHNGAPCDSAYAGLVQLIGICSCGYDAVFDMFRHFYGSAYVHGTSDAAYTGNLFKFDQNEFFANNDAGAYNLNDYGWAYVPTACSQGARCKIHIALHGCVEPEPLRQLDQPFGLVDIAGYLQAADKNNIIVVFPQLVFINPTIHFISALPGIGSCWDAAYGYTGCDYLYKTGKQVQFFANIIDRLANGTFLHSNSH